MNVKSHKQLEPPKRFNPVQITLEFDTEEKLAAFTRLFCHTAIIDRAGVRNEDACRIIDVAAKYIGFRSYDGTAVMDSILKG